VVVPVRRYILAAGSTILGYFVARFVDELVGLEPAAAALARWWHQNLPSFRFEEPQP
jgi:hypothetical protein